MASALLTGEGKTRQLKINNEIFHVNEDVLSGKSDYFRALFNPVYSDSQQEIIHIKDIVSEEDFRQTIEFCEHGKLDFPLDLSDLISLIVTAQTLAVDDLVKKCVPELSNRMKTIDNLPEFLEILNLSETLHIPEIRNRCVKRIALNFDSFLKSKEHFSKFNFSEQVIETILDFSQLTTCSDLNILEFILELPLKIEHSRLKLLQKAAANQKRLFEERLWIRSLLTIDVEHLQPLLDLDVQSLSLNDVEKTKPLFNSTFRSAWPYLHFIGAKVNPKAFNGKASFSCYSFNTRLKELENGFGFESIDDLDNYSLKGSSITSVADGFILVGGEYKYGKNSWNLDISKYTYSDRSFKKVGSLPGPRRHHTSLLEGDNLYLLGGFNSTRVMLADMIIINLSTGDQTCVELPHRGYNIAASIYKGKIVVALNGGIYLYSTESQSWLQRVFRPESMPTNVEFHHAFCFRDNLYLTCNFHKSVYRIDLSSNDYELHEAGKLDHEAERPCSYGPYLFNVSKSDILDFDGTGEKVIERLNLKTGDCETLYRFNVPVPVQDLPLFWRFR